MCLTMAPQHKTLQFILKKKKIGKQFWPLTFVTFVQILFTDLGDPGDGSADLALPSKTVRSFHVWNEQAFSAICLIAKAEWGLW